MNRILFSGKRLARIAAVAIAPLFAMAGASAVLGGAANAAVTPLSVTLSADGNGTAVFNASGDPVLTVGSTGGTYARMAVDLPAGSLAPATAPTFDTNNSAAGSPRWVIELANGNWLDGYGDEAVGGTGAWAVGNSGVYEPYATALSGAGDALGNVQVTSAFIVEDTGQAAGTADTLTGVQYNGQTLPGAVTVTNPGAQSWTIGKAASLQVTASTSASDPALAYTATGLPAGVSISASTGLISGTPTAAQSYATTVTATDAYGDTASQSFTWATSQPSVCPVSGNHEAATTAPAGLTASASGAREYFTWDKPGCTTGDAWFTSVYKNGRLMDTKVATASTVFYGALVKGGSYTVKVRWNDSNSPYSTVTFIAA